MGSWNEGSLTGKLQELVDDANRRHVNTLCVHETRWAGQKARKVENTGFKLWYSGSVGTKNDIGFLTGKTLWSSGRSETGDRIILVKLLVENLVLNVTSAYTPQVGLDMSAKRQFVEDLENVVRSVSTNKKLFIGEDINERVCTTNIGFEDVHGGFGYGDRNQEGKGMYCRTRYQWTCVHN